MMNIHHDTFEEIWYYCAMLNMTCAVYIINIIVVLVYFFIHSTDTLIVFCVKFLVAHLCQEE